MTARAAVDFAAIRTQFPGIHQMVNGRRLAYLDGSATMQRPRAVLEAMDSFYEHDNANVHRGVHTLSQRATDRFENARSTVRRFIGAAEDAEIIFTKGCTEAINLVASSWGRPNLKPGDQALVSQMEHHANIVPWQIVAEQTGATIVPIPIHDKGDLDMDAYRGLLNQKVKVVCIKHVCNALGTVNPVQEIAALAHEHGAVVVVDGAQGLAHERIDVRALGADFYAMAAHKVYGPMGVGALYGRRELLEAMPPYQTGGSMIRSVTFEKTTFAGLPDKFEPGTPNVAGVIGFGAALDFVTELGVEAIDEHERGLASDADDRLSAVPGVQVRSRAKKRAGIVSFTIEGVHPHDAGTVLDAHGVAVRTGHHCCMPLMDRLGVPATIRASFAAYNAAEDVDQLVEGVAEAARMLR